MKLVSCICLRESRNTISQDYICVREKSIRKAKDIVYHIYKIKGKIIYKNCKHFCKDLQSTL